MSERIQTGLDQRPIPVQSLVHHQVISLLCLLFFLLAPASPWAEQVGALHMNVRVQVIQAEGQPTQGYLYIRETFAEDYGGMIKVIL